MKFNCYKLFRELLQENHILLAGATGSGKSVMEHGLLYTALIDGNTRLVLLDPKRVELVQYKDLPQTLIYADTQSQMISALQWVVGEMGRRFDEMQNKRLRMYDGTRIIVVVDELADLMTTNKKECFPLLQRIAQLGRACKCQLICCTQTPIIQVIPTQLKCNFDCRVGLRTACAQDSRNIVGATGCELLPNPKMEHRAQAWIRRGADIDLWNIPMQSQDDIDALIQFRLSEVVKKVVETPQRKRSFWERVFG